MATDTIKIPASVLKSDLQEIFDRSGFTNSRDFAIGSAKFHAGEAEFVGIVAALSLASGRYEGHYHFRMLTPDEQQQARDAFDFNELPNLEG